MKGITHSNAIEDTRDPALSKFISALMEPVPQRELIDTAHNSQLRQARKEVWREAEAKFDMWKALLDAGRANKRTGTGFPGMRWVPDEDECFAHLRPAAKALMLTPAWDTRSLNWKRRVKLAWLMIDPAVAQRAIADDEAWLAAHPVSKRGGGSI